DAIRKTHIVDRESGGITQHVGAYEVESGGKKITFLDTPGHEAFSAMRSRGAKVADIAILVVDAVSGVQPQTKEAIQHIKKSGIGLVVAINKVDIPAATPERVKEQLMKEDILVESYGGKIPAIEVSAKTGKGLEQLLEMILLMAEMENLQGDLSKPAEGIIIEANLDNLRGPVATLLLRDGRLKTGDIIATSSTIGKIKGLENFRNVSVDEALPSMPVIVLGFENVPSVGDKVKAFQTVEQAQEYLQKRERKSGDSVVVPIEEGQKILNLILSTDVSGSIEAIKGILDNLPQEKVVLRVLKTNVGEITDNDIKLAESSKAVILGFRIKLSQTAEIVRERSKVKVLSFDIIYDLAQAVRQLMEKQLEPDIGKKILGKIKVLAIFRTEKNRQIIGGKVMDGQAKRGGRVEIQRGETAVGKGRIISLQENKKDASEVSKGRECGILFEGDARIEDNDILEVSEETRTKAEL
ncbi:MAG: translation initiation factor IF-2, partial [bacterium]|nr:translation initiation factor IF-2 [bacterium]